MPLRSIHRTSVFIPDMAATASVAPARFIRSAANGSLAWTNSVSVDGGCNFYYVSYAAVDTTSVNPGVVWTQSGCFGGIAKTRRDTGAQQWSVFTDDIPRASIDPVDGEIYDITNAGPQYNYDTLYSASADGTMVDATTSCEGYTELNPADGMLYRGGDTSSSGCGLVTLSTQQEHALLSELEFGSVATNQQL